MSSKVVLKGSIGFVGLAELLQQLGGSNSTGVVKLISEYSDNPGYIYMKDGRPINAAWQSSRGLEALNSFFGWMEGDFEFLEEDVTCDTLIKKSRMEIILDGLRMVDDGIIPKLGLDPTEEQPPRENTGPQSDLPIIRGPVIDYVYVVDEEEFSAGTEVVVQNKFGNWFWVVLSGEIEVIRILPEGATSIVRLGDGAYIGSMVSFRREGNVRSATLKALTDVQLGVLDSELIAREYSNLSSDFQKILISFDKRLKQVTDVCTRTGLGIDITADSDKTSDLLISADENENTCFRINAGEAYVVRPSPNGPLLLCTLTAGDFIGTIPFLNSAHEPYSAEVYVSRDFQAEAYDLSLMKEEYDKLSQTFINMLDHTSKSISMTTGRIVDLIKLNSYEN